MSKMKGFFFLGGGGVDEDKNQKLRMYSDSLNETINFDSNAKIWSQMRSTSLINKT